MAQKQEEAEGALNYLKTIEIKHLSPSRQFNNVITKKEVQKAITRMQAKKAVGTDELPNECYKHGGDVLVTYLTSVFNACFRLKFSPVEWQNSQTILLYKKGDPCHIKNYRPITLLNSIFKLWERVLEIRLREHMESNNLLSTLQFGSRAKRGTVDLLCALNTLLDQASGERYMLSIDLSKAYNRVIRSKLWAKLHEYGVEGELWHALMNTYSACTDVIKIGSNRSKEFALKNGVRQGSVLSPLLFIIYVNSLLERMSASGLGLPCKLAGGVDSTVPALMFVDDLLLLANGKKEVQELLNILIEEGIDLGLAINFGKSIFLGSGTKEENEKVNSSLKMPLNLKPSCPYLGTRISLQTRGSSYQIGHRIGKASAMLSTMKHRGITSLGLSNQSAKCVLYATIIPSLIYGMESFYLSATQYDTLDKFAADALKVKPTDKESSIPIWNLFEADMVPPSVLIKIAKLKLAYKIANLDGGYHILPQLHSHGKSKLFQETRAIMKKWAHIEGLKDALGSATKSTMKLKLKDLKVDIVDKTYYESTKGSCITEMPHRLPSQMDNTLRRILLLHRKEYITSQSVVSLCPVCSLNMLHGSYVHSQTECNILSRQLREEMMWMVITQADPDLKDHLQGLPKSNLLEYVLCLRQFNDGLLNNIMLKAAEVFFPIS